MKQEVDCYILRDLATGKHSELVVGPEPWIRQRFHECQRAICTQLHVAVDHVRTHEVAPDQEDGNAESTNTA